MSTVSNHSSTPRPARGRIWKAPTTRARWIWLGASLVPYAIIYILYYIAVRTQAFPAPINDPFRSFGIVSFVLVLATAAYSLRRRFVRGLPGKARDWLWMHTWVGIIAVLIAFLHVNYSYILHDYCQNGSCFTQTYWAPTALYALVFLVLSGITGRLLDSWEARRIARDASANGIGIARSLEERILELEYVVERLSAGKSDSFKAYCLQALNGGTLSTPQLAKTELPDFQRANETLATRASLLASLRRQNRARFFIRAWRVVHITLACLALIVISYHAIMELLTNVWHFLPPA